MLAVSSAFLLEQLNISGFPILVSYLINGRSKSESQKLVQYIWPTGKEKLLRISSHQGNTDQNHNEVSPHTCQNGYK